MAKWLYAAELVLREAMETKGIIGLTNQQLFEAIKEKNIVEMMYIFLFQFYIFIHILN